MDIDNISLFDLLVLLYKVPDERFEIIDREKNFEFRTRYNILVSDLYQVIRELTIDDYVKGPVPDDNPNRKHPVWIFKKKVFGYKCYIKIKLINEGRKVIVISFHKDEGND